MRRATTGQDKIKKSLNLKTEVWGRGKGSRVSERDYALRPGHARAMRNGL